MTQVKKLATFVANLIKESDVETLTTILNCACNTAQECDNFQFTLNGNCITLVSKDDCDEIHLYTQRIAISVDNNGNLTIRIMK